MKKLLSLLITIILVFDFYGSEVSANEHKSDKLLDGVIGISNFTEPNALTLEENGTTYVLYNEDDTRYVNTYLNGLLVKKTTFNMKEYILTEVAYSDEAIFSDPNSISGNYGLTVVQQNNNYDEINTIKNFEDNIESFNYVAQETELTNKSQAGIITQDQTMVMTNLAENDWIYVTSAKNCSYAPLLQGNLYKRYNVYNEELSFAWDIVADMTLDAVLALISGPEMTVAFILSVIKLAADTGKTIQQGLYYNEYTLTDYKKVLVNGVLIQETIDKSDRYRRAWSTAGNESTEFLYTIGTPLSDLEFIEYCIGRYHNDYHSPNHTYTNACDTTCNICGGGFRSITHVYSYVCDPTCNVCNAARPVTHTYDYVCDPTCNVCNAARPVTHTYDYVCDPTCNVCRTTRPVTHTYDDVCDNGCNICFSIRSVTHTYDSPCDPTCNLCGYVRMGLTHTYTNDCDNQCNECGEYRVTYHTYTNSCDTTCNVCGATRSTTHFYFNDCDTTCNTCGVTRIITHKYTDLCDRYCNVCSYDRGDQCIYTGAWVDVSTSGTCEKYVRTCSKCGDSYTSSYDYSHAWTNSCDRYCNDCGYYRGDQCIYTGAWVDISTSGTCEKYVKTCSNCGNSYTSSYDYSHAWTNSCDRYCNDCGYYRGDQCTYTGAWVDVSTSGTCEKYVKTCSNCGNSYTSSYDYSHAWSDSCDKICNDCNYYRGNQCTYTGAWVDVRTSGTCEKYVRTCSKCGDSYTSSYDYSHAWSSSCDKYCNDCSYYRGDQCTYTGAWVDVRTSGVCEKYVKTCTKCGYSYTSSYDYTHIYSSSTDRTCNDCGYYR